MPEGSELNLCSVSLRRELANARVLARSFLSFHPEGRCTVLVLDERGSGPWEGEPFEVVGPADLGIESFEHLAALLAPPALRSLAGAALLRHLWRRDGSPIVQLDATTRIYAPLDELEGMLRDASLLVTPALPAPLPAEGSRPDQAEVSSWPAFDPGLIGVGPDCGEILDWWAEWSAWEGSSGAQAPVAADQAGWWVEEEERRPLDLVRAFAYGAGRWLDLAAGMAPELRLLRDPGFNTGYWSLGGRTVSRAADGWRVDGSPLRCFNFRGFDPEVPSLLSRNQDRISLAEEPGLTDLCQGYAAELEEQGAQECRALGYGFDVLPDGTRFGSRLRRLYAEWSRAARPPSVFSEYGLRAFFDWLNEPAAPGGATRFLYRVYLERGDLQTAIPVSEPDFGKRLADWARESGRAETEMPDALVPGLEAEPPPRPPVVGGLHRRLSAKVPFDAWGVNVLGYHRVDFGIAEAGRLLIDALDARQIPVLPIHDLALQRFKAPAPRFDALGVDSARFPINLACMNGDHIVDLARRAGPSLFEERYTIGYWAWEADRLPDDWLPAFDLVDEVWVPSTYVAEIVSERSPVPVNRVPEPVLASPARPLDRSAYGIGDDEFLFLYLFDFDSVSGRKNPLGVVDAFKEAFPSGEGAALLLKTSFAGNAVGEFELLRQQTAGHPHIHVVDSRVSNAERDSLLAGCDCYVSLHRSEGFGRTPAEAMGYARPVIATGYGGNTDFMTERNSYLVDYRLVEVGEGHNPYPPDARWADPDLGHAARLMRRVFENRDEASRRGRDAADDLLSANSVDAVGRIMEARLVEIRSRYLRESRAAKAATRPSLPRRVARRLLGRRPTSPERPPAEREGQLASVTAALLAQARAEARRTSELEGAGERHSAARS